MEPVTDILHDIHGLDAIPWWPLAPGWWVVILLCVLFLLAAATRYWLYYCGLMPGWRGDARLQLRTLKKALRNDDPREVAGRLSILLRRIAMARSGRQQAAGLSGDAWLEWLVENDSSGFNWSKRGQLLLEAPYMPPGTMVRRNEVKRLVVAAMRWVDTTAPVNRTPDKRWWQKVIPQGQRATDEAADV